MTKRFSLLFALLTIIVCVPNRQAQAVAWNDIKAGNPVLPGYFADPCCRKFGDTYYLYVTPDGWDVGRGPFCIWTSKDFVHWTAHKSPSVEAGKFWPETDFKWAPSVIKHNGRYYMYNQTPCMIWGAVGDTPLGPWKSLSEPGKPMIPDQTPKGSIVLDGEIFVDSDGQRYIWYSTWWTPTVAKLKADMCTIDGDPIQYFENGRNPGYKAPYGTIQGCMEAPYMFKHNGTYYLMYSDNMCGDSSYQVKYSYSKSPLGPFTYGKNNPILSTNDDDTVDGPGHHTILEDGGKIYIIYHRHDNPHAADGAHRQTCVDELHFGEDGVIEKVVPTHAGVGYLAPSTVRDTNVALGAKATASSFAGPDFGAGYATDENNGTLWKASEYKFPQWLQVDLGKSQKVARVETEFQFAQVPYQYVIETSNDAKTWKMYADRSKNTDWGPMIDKAAATARYFRLTITGDNNTQRPGPEIAIWNIKIYDGIDKPNQAPKVDAGPDKFGTSAFSTLPLVGRVDDDGLPNGPVTTVWKKISGPGTVTFGNADRCETFATFSAEGKYVLKLAASDGKLVGSDTVTYTIKPLGDKLISFDFDEKGGSIAVDSSGNAQDGYFRNKATRGTGVEGKALTLSGMGDYVSVPSLGKPGNLTVAAWVKPDSLSNYSAVVCANSQGRDAIDGTPQFGINGNGEIQLSVSGCSPADQRSEFKFTDRSVGKWTHIAAVYDDAAKTVAFYVDGKLDSTRTYSSAQAIDLSSGVRIGARSNGQYLDGKIDDMVIYNKPLTAGEVAGLISGVKWVGVADARKLADGQKVTLKAKAVTYAPRDLSGNRCSKYFYIAEPDGSAVLRVDDGLTGQDSADTETGATLMGVMRTSAATGERYLELSAPLEIESSAPISTANVEAGLVGSDTKLEGKLVAFEAKIKSVAADAKSLVASDGATLISESEPVGLVAAGNTVSVVGVVSRVGNTPADAKNVVLLREVRLIDPAIPPVSDGLVAYYKLDEKSGTSVSDASGNGRNGTLGGGATWASGKIGSGVNLDGRGGHITLPTGIMKDISDFTICTWVKMDSRPTFSRIFDFGSGTGKYMMLCNLGEGIRYAITLRGNGADGEQCCDSDRLMGLGAWRHIAVTQSGNTVTLFVDGKQVGRRRDIGIKPSDLGATTQDWIGRSQYGDPTLGGKVDDFRIYNRVLTDKEITQIYNGY